MTKNESHPPELYKKLLLDEELEELQQEAMASSIIVLSDGHDDGNYKRLNGTTKSSSCCRKVTCRCLCKCAAITFLVMMVLTLIASGFTYFWMKDVVEHLTTTDSKDFPVVSMTDAELDVLKDRIKLFVDELRSGNRHTFKDDLVITQEEINGLLGHSDYLRGHIQVTLTPGKILEEFSLPTDMLPGGKHRFFYGTEYLQIKDDDTNTVESKLETVGDHEDWFHGPLFFIQLQYLVSDERNKYDEKLLELYLQHGSFFGNEIPQEVIDQHQNILLDLYNDPENGEDVRAIIGGIDSVSIEQGRIVIKPIHDEDEVHIEVEMEREEDTGDSMFARTNLRSSRSKRGKTNP